MKEIIVNGQPCRLVPFADCEPCTGIVVGQRFGRRVYRILCEDGDDLIMRNVRNASLVVAIPRREVTAEFARVEKAR